MRTTGDSRSRWLALSLSVLSGPVLLSACGSPAAPTAVEVPRAAVVAEGGSATKSGSAQANFVPCRYCAPAVDPFRVPPNKLVSFSVTVANTGDAPADLVPVAISLLGADGRRIPAGQTDHAAPRPGERVTLGLRFEVPSETAAGRYLIEVVLDPENRIAESDETDNTWLSPESLVVVAR